MASDQSFFGHPKGLSTLFFTEMWERFSYYGMRALLLLFMLASVEEGGMGLDEQTGGAIYGLYTMFVYLLALPGGWLADKFFGLRRSVFYGGCIIALGHFAMAIPSTETFFIGLLLIVIGTGLLKPNISSLVGELYSVKEQAKRDAGFTIFYAGINSGAAIAPIITGYLGQRVDWHYGFGVAGLGMALGLIQYKLTEKNLGSAGLEPVKLSEPHAQAKIEKNIKAGLWGLGIVLSILLLALFTHTIEINPIAVGKILRLLIPVSAVVYFLYILFFQDLDRLEKKKVTAIAIFFIATGLFYAGFFFPVCVVVGMVGKKKQKSIHASKTFPGIDFYGVGLRGDDGRFAHRGRWRQTASDLAGADLCITHVWRDLSVPSGPERRKQTRP